MILRRLGNKSAIAKEIQKYFPPHKIYIEPFFGAGGMFFNKPKARYNIVNDLDSDVFNLFMVVMNQKDELEIRDLGSEEFNIDLRNLSRSSIGKALMTKYYSQITGLEPKEFMDTRTDRYVIKVKDILDPAIEFKTPEFNNLLNKIKSSTIYITQDKAKSAWGFSLLYNGTKYIVAKGGLHSKDNPKVFDIIGNNVLIMRDADVKYELAS